MDSEQAMPREDFERRVAAHFGLTVPELNGRYAVLPGDRRVRRTMASGGGWMLLPRSKTPNHPFPSFAVPTLAEYEESLCPSK